MARTTREERERFFTGPLWSDLKDYIEGRAETFDVRVDMTENALADLQRIRFNEGCSDALRGLVRSMREGVTNMDGEENENEVA
jgi:hypothetical protein